MRRMSKRKLFLGLVLLLLFIASFVHTVSANPPAAKSVGSRVSMDPLLNPRQLTLQGAARKAKIQRLLKALDVLITTGMRKAPKAKLAIVEAALYAQAKTGVDAMLMIALARQESDFRGLTLINAPCKFRRRTRGCYADCGMTQHHVRGSLRYVLRECKRLAKDHKYSFFKSAEEIARHINWCSTHPKYHRPLRRCVLNRYNMGPFYKTPRKCKKMYRCETWKHDGYSPRQHFDSRLSKCFRDRRKCFRRASYWQQLSCFEYGGRNGIRARRTCRRCRNLKRIPTYFYPRLPRPSSLTSFLFARLSR